MKNNLIKKRIAINIRSLITDLENSEFDPMAQKGCAPFVDNIPEGDDCTETIEFSTEGTLTVKENVVEITYKENEALGMGDVESTLRFKISRPTMINLIRRGAAPASLLFDTEFPRRNCTYCIGNLPFSFCICTNEVINDFSPERGSIVLDYDIEMHGVNTEHNVYTLEYKELRG